MEKIIENAFAKINLTLSVGKKRSDNYHEIDTIMHSISLHDVVTFEKSDKMELIIKESIAPENEDNLMWKVAESFFEYINEKPCVRMELYKRIPSQAGLGGASADAAATLRGLNKLTNANLSINELCEIGTKHGADIPFCIHNGAARCRGIGEKVEKVLNWRNIPLIIVKPFIEISTKKAYEKLDLNAKRNINSTQKVAHALRNRDFKSLCANLYNDFQSVLFDEYEGLYEFYNFLQEHADFVQMSGSGSAFFLICENIDEVFEILQENKNVSFIEKATTI